MTNLFKHVISAVIENNEANGGSFSDWDDAAHAIETYIDSWNGDLEVGEMESTEKHIQKVLDGKSVKDVYPDYTEEVWGARFNY